MTNSFRVCVVGGGPAGMVLGLLLARAGAQVSVLEKHADFLRDFRGDTVHASTLTLLDELGLGGAFARLPNRSLEQMYVTLDSGSYRVADMTRLPGRHRQIALVPQWDLLEMLARAAAAEPGFTLRRNAEVVDVLRRGDAVAGVRWRDRPAGAASQPHDLAADLVVACDGRHSAVRRAVGRVPRRFGVPMDVEWFRLSRTVDDPAGGVARFRRGRMVVMIDRGEYWQCGYVVAKGADRRLRQRPVAGLAAELTALLPWLGERPGAELASWDDVRLLTVALDRLRHWSDDGLLFIGDAAHAMSPVGGVGINLAVQDAVATGRIVGDLLRGARSGDPVDRAALAAALRRVQRRRRWPAALVQTVQRVVHRVVIGRALRGDDPIGDDPIGDDPIGDDPPPPVPLPIRLLQRVPALQGLTARAVAIGPLPERAPVWARRVCPTP